MNLIPFEVIYTVVGYSAYRLTQLAAYYTF